MRRSFGPDPNPRSTPESSLKGAFLRNAARDGASGGIDLASILRHRLRLDLKMRYDRLAFDEKPVVLRVEDRYLRL